MRFVFSFLLLFGVAAFASDNLLPGGGFEAPIVKGRVPREQGGDPSNNGKGPGWIFFKIQSSGSNGKVAAGLTNEVARSGRQSLFIQFDHVNGPNQGATLISNFIPVVSGTDYAVGIWGRTDAKDLINSEGRSAYLKIEVDYFAKDANESVGEPFFEVQPLPGSKEHAPYFHPDRWDLFAVKLTPPPEAIFAQITLRWETGSDPGETNGIMYFDDAAMAGPAAPNPNMTPSPVQEETPAPAQ